MWRPERPVYFCTGNLVVFWLMTCKFSRTFMASRATSRNAKGRWNGTRALRVSKTQVSVRKMFSPFAIQSITLLFMTNFREQPHRDWSHVCRREWLERYLSGTKAVEYVWRLHRLSIWWVQWRRRCHRPIDNFQIEPSTILRSFHS